MEKATGRTVARASCHRPEENATALASGNVAPSPSSRCSASACARLRAAAGARLPCIARGGPATALRRSLAGAALAGALAWGSPARAAETQSLAEAGISPDLAWAASQLIPSPTWHLYADDTRFGLRWQLTPVLYSFGRNRRLSPWRSLLAEPLARHAGALEIHVTPEYLFSGAGIEDHVQLTGGVRAYFPLLHRGEYLSCSLGGSAFTLGGEVAAAYEAGLYTLFGVIGVQVAYSPTRALRGTTLTLNLRYF
ncbi:hypothetical protein WME90_35050 [Sorangium sp. So ce375]|uniref:hypothetical protein n=1 Tax=Sorangium sp. So ce375 TaxID=3133306 RepID=UPI003F5C1AB6